MRSRDNLRRNLSRLGLGFYCSSRVWSWTQWLAGQISHRHGSPNGQKCTAILRCLEWHANHSQIRWWNQWNVHFRWKQIVKINQKNWKLIKSGWKRVFWNLKKWNRKFLKTNRENQLKKNWKLIKSDWNRVFWNLKKWNKFSKKFNLVNYFQKKSTILRQFLGKSVLTTFGSTGANQVLLPSFVLLIPLMSLSGVLTSYSTPSNTFTLSG